MKAILCNQISQTCDEEAFLLPSVLPQENLANYSVNLDPSTGIFHVASRYRYMKFKEFLELNDSTPVSSSIHALDFSNGKVSAVSLHGSSNTGRKGRTVRGQPRGQQNVDNCNSRLVDARQLPRYFPTSQASAGNFGPVKSDDSSSCISPSACSTPLSVPILDPIEASNNVTVSAGAVPSKYRKPFQEKGSRLTIDALASMQQALIDAAPDTKSSSAESRNDSISTPATSAPSPRYRFALDLLELKVPGGTSSPIIGFLDLAGHDLLRCCSATGLLTKKPHDEFLELLPHLDLCLTSKVKDVAYAIEKKYSPLCDSAEVQVALDVSSGELYLSPVASYRRQDSVQIDGYTNDQDWAPLASQPLRVEDIDLDAEFGDHDDFEWTPSTPIVKLPAATSESQPMDTLHVPQNATSVQPRAVVLEDAPPSSNGCPMVFGENPRYLKHRQKEDGNRKDGECLLHHINFNGDPVYQRSYTPPEVSYWAAATTYDKDFAQQPRLAMTTNEKHFQPLPPVLPMLLRAQAFRWVDPTKYTGDDPTKLWEKIGSAFRDAATSDVEVVYQEEGFWYQDTYTDDDMVPRLVPDDLNYEYATNGTYVFHQLPIFLDEIEEERYRPKRHPYPRATQHSQRTSFLQWELGAELLNKAARFQEKLHQEALPRKSATVLRVIEEEPSENGEEPAFRDEEEQSEEATNVQDGINPYQEALSFVESSDKLQEGEPNIKEDPIAQQEEDNSAFGSDIESVNSEGEPQSLSNRISETTLEDGRYCSPSKMVPSRIDFVRTPTQSPSKADDLGSWEVNGDGIFESPKKHHISTTSEPEADNDEYEREFKKTDVFDLGDGQGSVNFVEARAGSVMVPELRVAPEDMREEDNNANRSAFEALQALEDPDVDGQIAEGYALTAGSWSRRQQRGALTNKYDDDEEAAVETECEEGSFDGEKGITNHGSVWAERPDRIAHPEADLLSRNQEPLSPRKPNAGLLSPRSEDKGTLLSEEVKADLLSRFSDHETSEPKKRSTSQDQIFTPSTRLGDFALGPEYPKLIVGGPQVPNFDDPTITDVLGISSRDAVSSTASNHHVTADDSSEVASDLEDPSSVRESETPEYETSSYQIRQLSPIQEGTEDDSTPIKTRKSTVRSEPRRCSRMVQTFGESPFAQATNMYAGMSDEDFAEWLEEKAAQEDRKRVGFSESWASVSDNVVGLTASAATSTAHSRNSSGNFSTETLPSSLGGEDIELELKSFEDEIASAFGTVDAERLSFMQNEVIVNLEAGQEDFTFDKPENATDVKIPVGAIGYDYVANKSGRSSHAGVQYRDIALGLGQCAIELVHWVFWKCMW